MVDIRKIPMREVIPPEGARPEIVLRKSYVNWLVAISGGIEIVNQNAVSNLDDYV